MNDGPSRASGTDGWEDGVVDLCGIRLDHEYQLWHVRE